MQKEFILYEQALNLNQLGFDESCIATTDQIEYIHIKGTKSLSRGSMMYDTINCPTYSQAFRWFREKYKMDSVIIRSFSMTNSYHYNIVIDQDYGNDLQSTSIPNRTYEEAELECLKKLIEIVDG